MVKKFFKKFFNSKKVNEEIIEVFNFGDLQPAIVKDISIALQINDDGSMEPTFCEEVCRF